MERKIDFLFLCLANRNRSIAGEEVFNQMLRERGFSVYPNSNCDFRVGSAGVFETAVNRFSENMLDGTRNVFFADKFVWWEFMEVYRVPWNDRFVELEIPDRYDINSEWQRKELDVILRSKLKGYAPIKR